MRITKRIREKAAHLCAIAASTDWGQDNTNGDVYPYGPVPDEYGSDAERLAWDAERIAWKAWRDNDAWTCEAHWAEAEAMLRTGWTP